MKITPNPVKQLKYIPKIWSTILYFILVGVVLIVFAARKFDSLRFDILNNLFPDYYQHISNFSISFMLILVSGYTAVLVNKSLKVTYIYALILIAVNVIYELFLPFINTMDIIDAYYGIVGSLMPFLYLIPYQRHGVKINPNYISLNSTKNPVI